MIHLTPFTLFENRKNYPTTGAYAPTPEELRKMPATLDTPDGITLEWKDLTGRELESRLGFGMYYDDELRMQVIA